MNENDPEAPVTETRYPDDDAPDEAQARTTYGRVFLDGADKQIVVRPDRGLTGSQIKMLVEWARQHRDGPGFDLEGGQVDSVAGGEFIEVACVGLSFPVVRCRVDGCDSFLSWHEEDLKTLDKCGLHVTSERSTAAFRCRLVLVDGVWIPDYGPRAGMKVDPIGYTEELAFALMDVASAARRLNGQP